MNTNENEMNANELAALFGGSNDLAAKASTAKATITPLAKAGDTEYYRLRLPNSEAKSTQRQRVKVAMRQIKAYWWKGGTMEVTGIIEESRDANSVTYLVKGDPKKNA